MDAEWSEPTQEETTAPAPNAPGRAGIDLRGCAPTIELLGDLGRLGWWLFTAWVVITAVTGWFGLVGGAVIVGALIIASAVSKD